MYQTLKKYSFPFSLLLLLFISACEKEYSYEGGAIPPTVILVPIDSSQSEDSTHLDPGEIPPCLSCFGSGEMPDSSWTFKAGNSLVCGKVTNAVVLNLERSNFTFFGPAACGTDTGLIFTVYLGLNALKRDTTNLVASNAVFYYYHTYQPYILYSLAGLPFALTISSYNHSTKLATGTFSGTAFRQDGVAVNVTEGKFKIRLN